MFSKRFSVGGSGEIASVRGRYTCISHIQANTSDLHICPDELCVTGFSPGTRSKEKASRGSFGRISVSPFAKVEAVRTQSAEHPTRATNHPTVQTVKGVAAQTITVIYQQEPKSTQKCKSPGGTLS